MAFGTVTLYSFIQILMPLHPQPHTHTQVKAGNVPIVNVPPHYLMRYAKHVRIQVIFKTAIYWQFTTVNHNNNTVMHQYYFLVEFIIMSLVLL